ncbi:MAG: InlB B-repeat-containing protein [Clostridiales Family XIII bacterium]|nr:InlB B-repeat-containing protein [Clostridiales Family XIII bacterium]
MDSNYFTEPIYHFEVIDAETGDSVQLDSFSAEKGEAVSVGAISLMPIGSKGREEYRIEGLKKGVSIIKITYDAIVAKNSIIQPREENVDNSGGSGNRYCPAIAPRNTGIVIVKVDQPDSSGIDLNIATPGARGADGEDDILYFPDTEDGADYTFSPTSGIGDGKVSLRVRDPLPCAEWQGMSGAGWTDYGTNDSGGEFTVRLKDGRNIIEASSGGATKYHVVTARAVPVTIVNESKPNWKYGDFVEVGDLIKISIDGMKVPVDKLAGIYNPQSGWAEYALNGSQGAVHSNYAAYDYSNRVFNTFRISKAGVTSLTDGKIYEVWYGDKWGNHRKIPLTGRRPNLAAALVTSTPYHSMLPDFHFYTAPEEDGDTAPVTFTGQQDGTMLVVESNAGYVKTPNTEGVYTLPVGGPHRWYYYKEGCVTKTGEFGVGEGGATIALPQFTESDRTGQATGKAKVSVISDDAVWKNGQEVSFDADSIPKLAAQGYTDYDYGGYTILHALIDAFKSGSPIVPFTASHGLLSPSVQLGENVGDGAAGWVCEVNGSVVPTDSLWTTLARDGDDIVYYHNPAVSGEMYARFEQPEQSVERGETATFTLMGKGAAVSGGLSPIAGATIYIDGRASGLTDADGKAELDTSSLTLDTHIVTAGKGSPNTLTYARGVLTVTRSDTGNAEGITFRLVGAKKHDGQEGFGPRTEYETWVDTVTYPLKNGQASVYTVLDWALKNAGLEYRESMANYIGSIKSPDGEWLEEMDNGPASGWMYTVNGIHSDKGLRVCKVSPGDEIVWHYVDDPGLETTGIGGTDALPPYANRWLAARYAGGSGELNKAALESLVAAAEALKESDYTAESWLAVASALASAKAAIAGGAAQGDIDEAYVTLLAALEALTNASGGTGPVDSQEPPQQSANPAPTAGSGDSADTKKVNYTIKFNVNGGKALKKSLRTRKVAEGKAIGKLPKPTRKNYNFEGWYSRKNGGKKVTARTKATGSVTLYAHWQKKLRYGSVVKAAAVFVRARPSDHGNQTTVVGYLEKGAEFRIRGFVDNKGTNNDWYRLEYKGKTAYVYARYVKVFYR